MSSSVTRHLSFYNARLFITGFDRHAQSLRIIRDSAAWDNRSHAQLGAWRGLVKPGYCSARAWRKLPALAALRGRITAEGLQHQGICPAAPVNPRCEFEAFGELSRTVEHVFGSMTNEQGGLYFRVIGLARTATKIGLINLVNNMRHPGSDRQTSCVWGLRKRGNGGKNSKN